MALGFGTTGKYILLGIDTLGPLLDGAPAISWAGRIYVNNAPTSTERPFAMMGGAGFVYFGIAFDADDTLRIDGRSGANPDKLINSTGTVNAAAWNVCGGVFDFANDDIYVYLNGSYESSLNVSFGDTAYDHVTSTRDDDAIGVMDNNGIKLPLDGNLAEIAMWGTALQQDSFDIYNGGYSPKLIHPESLVGYWPLIGQLSTEIELINGNGGTVTGATTETHPPVIYPSVQVYTPPAPAAPAGVPAHFMHYSKMRRV
jgi:hypothetical protein